MTSYHPFLSIAKNIRLPEYGYIGITALEQSIIDTFPFQRLRRIRQSPGVSLTYPGASHFRFEHSLGAMYVAGEIALHLILNTQKNKNRPIVNYYKTDKERNEVSKQIQIARLGGLLHDIGHGPFSHTFETFLQLCDQEWPHEYLSIEIIWKKLGKKFKDSEKNEFGIDVRHVISLLCDIERKSNGDIVVHDETKLVLKKIGLKASDITFMERFLEEYWYLNHIIKEDPYNADRFNYLILDSNRSGAVEYGSIDFERLIQNLHIHNNRIVTVSTKAKDSALRFFEAYSHMYKSIYQHKSSYGADLHLSYAMFMASEKEPNGFFGKLRKKHDMETVLPLFDDVLIHQLYLVKNKKCKQLICDFLERRLLSRIYETNKPKFQTLLEDKGKEGLIKEIIRKARVKSDVTIRITSVIEKRASPAPVTEEALRRVSFLNSDTGETEPIDEEIIQVLSPRKSYRIYVTKDKEVIRKTLSAVKSLVN